MRSTARRGDAELTERAERRNRSYLFPCLALCCCMWPRAAHAMHLADGMLPLRACIAWWLGSGAVVALAFRRFDRERLRDPQLAPLMAMLGAAVFAISCMPVP